MLVLIFDVKTRIFDVSDSTHEKYALVNKKKSRKNPELKKIGKQKHVKSVVTLRLDSEHEKS